ncbi:carbohydrate kinase family protein [Cellulomonas endophytica]|uniref:carbohydrate kinase family protein n=1 Tax=Cellulomonas endophytica TaxID=2494735 RepID=UPI0010101F54|nr:carbohydrate kinase [Cellulomonas endophytica]
MPSPIPTGELLVIGEVVADIVQPLAGPPATHPGGSPANVALGLARLGDDVTLLTQIGDDAHGDLIRAHLRGNAVQVLTAPAPGPGRAATPSAIAHLDHTGAATYTFDITWTLPVMAPPRAPLHVHTGSVAALMAPGADAVRSLVEQMRGRCSISFDPNIRPALVRDHGDGVARVEQLVGLSDVVKASDEDIAYLYPGTDPVRIAQDWLHRGPAVVVVTLGGEGSVVATRAGVVRIEPTVVTVADTVGAGDAFMSTLVDGLGRSRLLGARQRAELSGIGTEVVQRVARRASHAAAITVARPGAAPPFLHELDETEAHAR